MAEKDSGGIDARTYKRRHLIYYLEVFDDDSGKLLGHLVDLTLQGMRLISKEELTAEKEFRIRMKLPEEYFEEGTVTFVARSMWCRKDINPDFFAVGFKVEGVAESTATVISDLIDMVGFND